MSHPRALPRPPELKALVLDFDGTLVDSEPLHTRAWGEAGRVLGFAPDTPWLHQVGVSDDVIAARIQKELTPHQSTAALLTEKNAQFHRLFPSLVPAPGAVALLQWAAQKNLRVAIASSGIKAYVPDLARHLGFGPFVELFACGDEVAHKKPAPDVFLLALNRLGLNATEAIVVEDSPAGTAAASAAGIACIALSLTSPPQRLEGASLVVPDLTSALHELAAL